MHLHRASHSSVAGAVVVAALAGAQAASAASTGPNTTVASAITQAAQPTRIVPLATGEKVTVSTAGGTSSYSVTGTDGSRDAYATYGLSDGDRYIIPAEAEPFVADGSLSLSLFDVTAY